MLESAFKNKHQKRTADGYEIPQEHWPQPWTPDLGHQRLHWTPHVTFLSMHTILPRKRKETRDASKGHIWMIYHRLSLMTQGF